MAKKKDGNSINGSFTAINHQIMNGGLDIYEIVVISEVASWNRQEKKYYVSQATIAKNYGVSRKKINKVFDDLTIKGILFKGDKLYNNQYEYRVNIPRLMTLIKEYRESSCNQETQLGAQAVTQEHNSCNPELQNKNNKNINKNILVVDEEALAASSLPNAEELETIQTNKIKK